MKHKKCLSILLTVVMVLGLFMGLNTTPVMAAANNILAENGSGQSAEMNTAYASPLYAVAVDSIGNTVSGTNVTFTVSAGASGASATFTGGSTTATVTTGASGFAVSPTLIANGIAGSFTVTATGAPQTASFNLTNLPAPANKLAFIAQPSDLATHSAIAPAVKVQLEDSTGTPLATSGVNVSLQLIRGGGIRGAGTVATGANGVAVFDNVNIDVPGTYHLLATALNTASALSNAFVVSNFILTGKTDTTASFSFTPPTGATAVKIRQSTDGGTNWSDSTTGSLDASSTTATATNLTPSTPYKFKLVVTGGSYAGDSNIVDVTTNAPTNACQIGVTQYTTLDAALAAITNNTPTTIKLLQDINYSGGLVLNNKKITFNLNTKMLTLNNNNVLGWGMDVENGSVIDITNSGVLNATGSRGGLYVYNSSIKVTNASGRNGQGVWAGGHSAVTITNDATSTASASAGVEADSGSKVSIGGNVSGGSQGVYADGPGSDITVAGSVTANGTGGVGADARFGATITVNGNVTGVSQGVFSLDTNSSVTVKGNVIATGAAGIGVYANNGATATIDGTITAPTYIKTGSTTKTAADKEPTTSKSGYFTYSDVTNTVWVKDTGALNPTPISDFTSTGKTDTTVSFSFTAPSGASAVKIQQSTDGGTNWTDSTAGALDASSTTATATGLTQNTAYKFKLVVTGGSYAGDSNVVNVTTNASNLPTVSSLENDWGDPWGAEGATVTIYGTGFTGATGVKFGTNAATSFTVDTDTQITATAPAGTGKVDVTVTTAGGTSITSDNDQFTYLASDELVCIYEIGIMSWNPRYNPGITSYTTTCELSGHVTFGYVLADPNAIVKFNGNLSDHDTTNGGLADGIYTIDRLNHGANTVTVEVDAPNGKSGKTYTVTVYNPPNGFSPNGGNINTSTSITIDTTGIFSRYECWYTVTPGNTGTTPTTSSPSFKYNIGGTGFKISTPGTYTVEAAAYDPVTKIWSSPIQATYNVVAIGGDSGGSFTPAPVPEPTAQVLDSNGNVSGSSTPKLDNSTGTASIEVDAASLTSAFDKSKTDDKGVKTVEVDIPKIDGAKAYESILPASFLNTGDSSKAVEIKTDIASVTVPGNMLSAANAAGAQNISLTIAAGDKSKLSADVQAQIGDRPVIELSLKVDGKQTAWSNSSAPVTVSIPYTPTADELKNPEHITVWYIDGSGKAVSVPSGRYDPATGMVTFSTTHFSQYAVTFVQKTFEDLIDYGWAKKQIEVLASKGIINGTSKDTFSPAANITRADYLVLLVRTLGLTAEFDSNFDDVKPGTYYYEAVGIAKKLGIAAGIGNNRFNPKDNISRQDMMVLTARALEKFKKLELLGSSAALDKFKDKADIAGYAVESMATLVKEGLIAGSGDTVNPRSQTTRAEAAVFLYRIYNKY